MIDKKQLLFDLRDYINFISFEDLQEILQNAISYYFAVDNLTYTGDRLVIEFDNDVNFTINIRGIQEWWKDGSIHRENNKPAVISSYVTQYIINDEFHRDNDQPAIIYNNGHKEWWVDGKFIKDNSGKFKIK